MSELLQQAKQARSRDTQDRILTATERLLVNEPFEAITVRRIVQEADTSVGSFYARFRDKSALLPVLYAEYEKKLERRLVRLRQAVIRVESLEDVARLTVDHFIATFGEVPNLSRALFAYATRAPASTESKELATRRREQHGFLLDALMAFKGEIDHADPDRAAELGFYFVSVACRNRLLYPMNPQTRILKISRRELREELVRMLLGYLRAEIS